MVDVFISYSRSNRERVRVLADAVKALGYVVWWDDELPPHKSYGDVITEKIAAARAAIVCWSADAAQSEWVRAEADLARNQKKLIQTSYDDVMPPMPFNQIQFASLADWKGQADHSGWRKVQASLSDLCGPPGNIQPIAAVSPVPPPPARSSLSPALLGAGAVVLLLVLVAVAWMALGGDVQDTLDPQTPQTAEDSQASDAPDASDDATGRYRLAAMIDDPDGFTNIRAKPATNAEIVGKINTGEAFTTFEQTGPWWQVRTADGLTGFMARSRIRLLRDGVPVAAAPPAAAAPAASLGGAAPATPSEPAPGPITGPITGPVTATGSRDGQIIPDSDSRRLGEADIAALGPQQLRLARNEIFARKGRRFQKAALRNHFSRFAWYRPVADNVSLNATEQANVDLLAAAERGR